MQAKVKASEKIRVVEEYLAGKINVTDAAWQCRVDRKTVSEWINCYLAEGASGLIPAEHNRIYTKETKIAAVKDYLAGKGSLLDICRIYKIKGTRQLRDWLKVYNGHKEFRILTGGSRMTKGRTTTPDEKILIVRECIQQNNNYGQIALKYQVTYQQVYTWVKRYRTMGEEGFKDYRGRRAGTLPGRTPEEELRYRIAQLEREKLDLTMENDLLKKVKEIERRWCRD